MTLSFNEWVNADEQLKVREMFVIVVNELKKHPEYGSLISNFFAWHTPTVDWLEDNYRFDKKQIQCNMAEYGDSVYCNFSLYDESVGEYLISLRSYDLIQLPKKFAPIKFEPKLIEAIKKLANSFDTIDQLNVFGESVTRIRNSVAAYI